MKEFYVSVRPDGRAEEGWGYVGGDGRVSPSLDDPMLFDTRDAAEAWIASNAPATGAGEFKVGTGELCLDDTGDRGVFVVARRKQYEFMGFRLRGSDLGWSVRREGEDTPAAKGFPTLEAAKAFVRELAGGGKAELRGGRRENSGRRAKSPDGKAVTVSFSCSPEERRRLDAAVAESGLALSEYVREKLFGELAASSPAWSRT